LKEWWSAGKAPVLVIQAAEDRVAPPENADKLLKENPDRVQVRVLKHAGHAMLPEQPQLIGEIVINWLREQH
jgi:pimeloyl-ACP methyl ester carboxylesterase